MVDHAELMSILFTSGTTSQDIDNELRFPELQHDDPANLLNVMRSYDVLHESGMDHRVVMIYRLMIMVAMQ
eukprot:71780-Prorocentrum_lima.AAC.1